GGAKRRRGRGYRDRSSPSLRLAQHGTAEETGRGGDLFPGFFRRRPFRAFAPQRAAIPPPVEPPAVAQPLPHPPPPADLQENTGPQRPHRPLPRPAGRSLAGRRRARPRELAAPRLDPARPTGGAQ